MPDALSRVQHNSSTDLAAISVLQPLWMTEIQQSYLQDESATKLLTALSTSTPNGHYSLTKGLIHYKGRIWVGDSQYLKEKILLALHASAVGGHSGFEATYMRVKKLFAWTKMKQEIKTFVSQCSVCQQAKTERVAYPGLLTPLPVPEGAWQVVSLDFIEGLPKSGSSNCILVVVDKFSKYAHFLQLAHPFTALQVATAYMNNIFKLHGFPEALISDRDRVFTSNAWQELFRLVGTDLRISTAYHPQMDGQTERVNQCLKTYLRCFVHACPNKWSQYLPLAEFWYNTSYHSSLATTPFKVLYGHEPRQLGITGIEHCRVPDLQQWLTDRALMQQLVQQHLLRAQKYMKYQADKHRTDRNFDVGDWVYLKVQPYVQSSLALRSSNKLSFRFFGPYQIVNKINDVAYKLLLPPTSTVHPVFHVSLLKKAVSPTKLVSAELPDVTDHLQVPIAVLDRRLHQQNTKMIPQVLIQWSGWPVELSTWEDEEALRQQFPNAPAWGQAGSKGGEDVTNPTSEPAMAPAAERKRTEGLRQRKRNLKTFGLEWVN